MHCGCAAQFTRIKIQANELCGINLCITCLFVKTLKDWCVKKQQKREMEAATWHILRFYTHDICNGKEYTYIYTYIYIYIYLYICICWNICIHLSKCIDILILAKLDYKNHHKHGNAQLNIMLVMYQDINEKSPSLSYHYTICYSFSCEANATITLRWVLLHS